MTVVLVTGTGTDIGKTIATAALATALRGAGKEVHVVKPIQTGVPGKDGGDLDTVRDLTGETNLHGFERYPEPMAPVAAAQRAGMRLPEVGEIAEKIRLIDAAGSNRVVLVEGAGGLLVRLGEDWALPELAGHLPGHQMVVVTRLDLGCLNEAELTVEVARGRGVEVTALLGGKLPAQTDPIIETNLEQLPRITGLPLLGSAADGAGELDRETFEAQAPGWFEEAALREWIAKL
ncbi:dethiobiotin synthase [Corynebacterium lactis]|uniref:ATP-dependent dethiobiotin synthetase BioD n=1 Tax=Corynebacterium lactis RW2-5 TaxID=1408189 RepID=A0A0K2H0C6_9CORY|nr:dethiobiotin synthase [Corynebacterium lactis]ALA67484.1 dithiobiotin synthetase [Corynebacterium lactis RW2-5]